MSIQQKLIETCELLDISPTDFKRAQDRFTAIKNYLSSGSYTSGTYARAYYQGSFRLGTVVRPYRNEQNKEFDVDQVFELSPSSSVSSEALKKEIGYWLEEHGDYERMLLPEGKRCWTIEYASDASEIGFHVDILPCVTSNKTSDGQVFITHKEEDDSYSWRVSNPEDYYYWFKSRNLISSEFLQEERSRILAYNRNLYENVSEVPKQLVRTPLQRAIQITKRHRDVTFSNKDNKPISIIITTIMAHLYSSQNISDTVLKFANYVIARHKEYILNDQLEPDGILDHDGHKWIVKNPIDVLNDLEHFENFADKWETNLELPANFFKWVYKLKRNLNGFILSESVKELNLAITNSGDLKSYFDVLKESVQSIIEGSQSDNTDQLNMINLALDGKTNWDSVERSAYRIMVRGHESLSDSVAKINYYQVLLHQGKSLSEEMLSDIREIRQNYCGDAAYELCCDILLRRASRAQLRECILVRRSDSVLEWPILRLLSDEVLYGAPASIEQ